MSGGEVAVIALMWAVTLFFGMAGASSISSEAFWKYLENRDVRKHELAVKKLEVELARAKHGDV